MSYTHSLCLLVLTIELIGIISIRIRYQRLLCHCEKTKHQLVQRVEILDNEMRQLTELCNSVLDEVETLKKIKEN